MALQTEEPAGNDKALATLDDLKLYMEPGPFTLAKVGAYLGRRADTTLPEHIAWLVQAGFLSRHGSEAFIISQPGWVRETGTIDDELPDEDLTKKSEEERRHEGAV